MISCSDDEAGIADTGAAVSYRSPIELSAGKRKLFEHRLYNSEGTTLLSIDTTAILVKDEITTINGIDLYQQFHEYHSNSYDESRFYSYQWENSRSGTVITYFQPDENLKRVGGVFIIGTYENGDTTLFDPPKLWLPFPADIGTAGDILTGGEFETVENTYVPLMNRYGRIIDTHLFKRESGNTSIYSYYEIDDGLSAMLIYENGKRIKSLKEI